MKPKLINLEYFFDNLEAMIDNWEKLDDKYLMEPEISLPINLLAELAKFVVEKQQSKRELILDSICCGYEVIIGFIAEGDVNHPLYSRNEDWKRQEILKLTETKDLRKWMRKVFTGILFTESIKRMRRNETN